MTLLRRGFKSEANWYARTLREELGLQPHDPLSPWTLAKHLAIPIVRLSELLPFERKAVHVLLTHRREGFSAATIFVGSYGKSRLICHNDGNATTRQASDISHELSHAILGHNPREMFGHDPTAEEEANWMGPALLVSDEAAYRIAFNKLSIEQSARAYGVSDALMKMRLNVSGAAVRVQRRRRDKRSA